MPIGTFRWGQFRETHVLGDWLPQAEVVEYAAALGMDGPFAIMTIRSDGRTALLQVDGKGRASARWAKLRPFVAPEGCPF